MVLSMASLVSVTSFDISFLGGMVLPNDERLTCSRSVAPVAKHALMAMTS